MYVHSLWHVYLNESRKKPSMLETRSPSLDTAMSQQPPQLSAPVPVAPMVPIKPGGELDTGMSIGEVVERLDSLEIGLVVELVSETPKS